jgi:hypothetical protein
MTFSYTPISRDQDRVRFHLGDTDVNAAAFSDEEIVGVITEVSDWKIAVIYLIQNLIAKCSTPNFTADWLVVDSASAVKSYQALLQIKRRELKVFANIATVVAPWRPDSGQTASPDYTGTQSEYARRIDTGGW